MKLVLVSALWCPSCLIMRPRYEEVKKMFNFVLEDVDYDDNEKFCRDNQVGKILPVCIVMKNDIEIKRIIGEKNKKDLESILGEIINEN